MIRLKKIFIVLILTTGYLKADPFEVLRAVVSILDGLGSQLSRSHVKQDYKQISKKLNNISLITTNKTSKLLEKKLVLAGFNVNSNDSEYFAYVNIQIRYVKEDASYKSIQNKDKTVSYHECRVKEGVYKANLVVKDKDENIVFSHPYIKVYLKEDCYDPLSISKEFEDDKTILTRFDQNASLNFFNAINKYNKE